MSLTARTRARLRLTSALATLVSGPVAALFVSSAHRLDVAVLVELSAALLVASFFVFTRLRRALGLLSATLCIATLWGLLSLGDAAISSTCPGYGPGRCTGPQLAANSLVGVLLVLAPAVLLLPARALYKAVVLIVGKLKRPTPKKTPKSALKNTLKR